jgi:hypothetical protein
VTDTAFFRQRIRALAGCTPGAASVLFQLRHDRFTPRSSACCHCFDWERANRKEERHEKEGQEEIKGNVTKCNARKVRLSPPAARKAAP